MKFIFVSTTAKHSKDFLNLPPKIIDNQLFENYLISNKKLFIEFLIKNDESETLFFLDCEQKQNISLYDIANKLNLKNAKVYPYKPNDLTVDAADILIQKFFDGCVSGKDIGIYGTGNIASKIALRLLERNANVYLFGRNIDKIKILHAYLKQASFNQNVFINCKDGTLDAFVSFVSGEKVINDNFIKFIKEKSLCLDGGIGNFSENFIELAINKNCFVQRVDVRASQEILIGNINSNLYNSFSEILGTTSIEGVTLVAGGIIGKYGDIIVDQINSPNTIIGFANGIGGLLDESEITKDLLLRRAKIEKFISENNKKGN